jgi:hypothetical protein
MLLPSFLMIDSGTLCGRCFVNHLLSVVRPKRLCACQSSLFRDKAALLEGLIVLRKCIALSTSHIDDEAIPSLLVDNLPPCVIDSVHRDSCDLRLILIESAGIHHRTNTNAGKNVRLSKGIYLSWS